MIVKYDNIDVRQSRIQLMLFAEFFVLRNKSKANTNCGGTDQSVLVENFYTRFNETGTSSVLNRRSVTTLTRNIISDLGVGTFGGWVHAQPHPLRRAMKGTPKEGGREPEHTCVLVCASSDRELFSCRVHVFSTWWEVFKQCVPVLSRSRMGDGFPNQADEITEERGLEQELLNVQGLGPNAESL